MSNYYEEFKSKKNYKLSKEEERMLEEVKTKVPIQDILLNEIYPTNPDYWTDGMAGLDYNHTCLCPLHQEDTASMRIFPDTNTCNCFAGCGGGDGVWLYREYQRKVMNHSITFKDAVRYLYSKYVEGKNLSTIAFTDLMKVVDNNTTEEVFLFFNRLANQERQLQEVYRRKLDHVKLAQYSIQVDTIKRLVSTREMLASVGIFEIEKDFKELIGGIQNG